MSGVLVRIRHSDGLSGLRLEGDDLPHGKALPHAGGVVWRIELGRLVIPVLDQHGAVGGSLLALPGIVRKTGHRLDCFNREIKNRFLQSFSVQYFCVDNID